MSFSKCYFIYFFLRKKIMALKRWYILIITFYFHIHIIIIYMHFSLYSLWNTQKNIKITHLLPPHVFVLSSLCVFPSLLLQFSVLTVTAPLVSGRHLLLNVNARRRAMSSKCRCQTLITIKLAIENIPEHINYPVKVWYISRYFNDG